jgi:renal tumor antigen
LREIQALKRLSPHPNIIHLEEVLFDKPSGRLAMVFELMDANLYDLISGRREHLDHELVLSLGYQMFIALQHMHDNGIFHRDIKPENILVDPKGSSLKLADLGSCRSINSSPPMTEYIATRWYRSPECLLTDGHYGPEMDIWGAGCVLFEIIALFPLFPGSDEVDQVNRIHKVVGTPEPDVLDKLKVKGSSKNNYKFSKMRGIGIKHFIPHASPFCVDLLTQTMIYAIEDRMTAEEAVNHDYFSKLREEDVSNTGKTKTSNNTSTKGKQSTKRYARVEPDHPSAANDKKQAAAKKKANKTKLETKKSTDSNRSKKGNLKFRSAKHTEKLSVRFFSILAHMFKNSILFIMNSNF